MKKWIIATLIVLILAGCNEKESHHSEDTLTMVEVEFLLDEQVPVNEELEIAVKVTQGDEFVNDAEEVKFEIWESGLRDEGVSLPGTFTKDGVYLVTHTFDHDGVYYIFAHTTARSMHVMPKQQLVVGTPDMSKVIEDNSDNSMNHSESSGHSN